jgi:hypothetical protein
MIIFGEAHLRQPPMPEIGEPRSGDPDFSPSTQRAEPYFQQSELGAIHLPQITAAQELQIKAEARLASLIEEKLVTRISVLSTLLGGGKTTERLLVRISIETHKTSPDFDQTAADKAKNRIKQALGEIGCDVFIETDR